MTAVNADAPPILQWDSEETRNPVSWYFWNGGATATQFGLAANVYHQVNAVALKPSMWNGGHQHQGNGVFFVIDGAKDSKTAGLCLFPEILKSEYHGIRSVIEAHSNSAGLQGADQQSAAGIMVNGGGERWDIRLRVWTNGRSAEYQLDRWD